MDYSYVIMTDISADMEPAEAIAADLRFIPMSYTLGNEDRVCSHFEDEETLHRMYEGQRHGDLTHTTQITPEIYKQQFSALMKDGTSILYLCLSSGLSNTYASSCVAAEWMNEKYPEARVRSVDSLSATVGMGLLLEKAIANRAAGMSLEENALDLEACRSHIAHWFMVEDLMYLKRGGRVSATTAVVGTALNIKPILKIAEDGSLTTFAKKRGEKAAMAQLVDFYQQSRDDVPDEHVYIAHCDCPEHANQLKQAVLTVNPSARVSIRQLSPIIGAHVGPGMCAIVHWGKR